MRRTRGLHVCAYADGPCHVTSRGLTSIKNHLTDSKKDPLPLQNVFNTHFLPKVGTNFHSADFNHSKDQAGYKFCGI